MYPAFILIMWSVFGSQNLPHPPRIYPLFNKFACATPPESTHPPPPQNIPPLLNNYVRPSQNVPFLQNITSFQQIYMCDSPIIYPLSQNITAFSTTICDTPRIYPLLPKYISILNKFICATLSESTSPSLLKRGGGYSGKEGWILGGSHNTIVV